jgi:predicted membrane protein
VVAEWPVDSSMSVGDLTVDLTGWVLPSNEEMRVGVGVGEIRLIVPAGAQVRVEAGVGIGDIRVDGVSVDNGFGPEWTEEAATSGAIVVDAKVGLGSIEVRHE